MTNKDKVLDISVNLARVSDWILSENEEKQKRVDQFLKETQEILSDINPRGVNDSFKSTLSAFKNEFEKLLIQRGKIARDEWAEQALTWANILQHRSKLI